MRQSMALASCVWVSPARAAMPGRRVKRGHLAPYSHRAVSWKISEVFSAVPRVVVRATAWRVGCRLRALWW